MTGRLCRAAARQVASGRSVTTVSREYKVGWPLVHRHLATHADALLIEPEAPHVLGIDETRRGRPRWIKNEATGRWARTELFETGFVDLSGSGGLLGQAAGRTGKAVMDWLNTRGQRWKNQVRIVAIDPAACYRTAIRQALPHAVTVVDHFHLVALANKTLTAVRQRVTRTERGRRDRPTDPEWANRRRLLARARERAPHSVISHRLIKDAARVAFGFRNLTNQRRRVRLACTHHTINTAA